MLVMLVIWVFFGNICNITNSGDIGNVGNNVYSRKKFWNIFWRSYLGKKIPNKFLEMFFRLF